MTNSSAKLFIASESDQVKDLQWRVKLVESQKLYAAEDLVQLIRSICKGSTNPPSKKERQEISKLTTSKKFEIDEFDQAVLFTIALLKNPSGISDKVAIITDNLISYEYSEYDGTEEEFANEAPVKDALENRKENLRKYADRLIQTDGSRIRAYLAFKEIAALFDPDTMIPHLVSLSPRYLTSPLTQKWILKQQYNSKYGKTKSEIATATKNLSLLNKAISGDRRKNKKRERPYWKVAFIYDDLVGYIDGFRRQKSDGTFDQDFFEVYCDDRKIPKLLRALITSTNPTSSELAIEIMIHNNVIKSEKSFREIQLKINKIQKRHFDGNILSIASDIRPVVFKFIDLPGTNPEVLSRIDPFKYLELVEIPKS